MNLRHKKPLNSYFGQTINSKDVIYCFLYVKDFLDDDFKHYSSFSKQVLLKSKNQG